MGLFLTYSIVQNNHQQELISEIRDYALANGGGIQAADVNWSDDNFCAVSSSDNKTVITYPSHFTEFLSFSAQLSQHLQAPVYTFHIHDGDKWVLYTFDKGRLISTFDPIDEDESHGFDLQRFCTDLNVQISDVEKYFVYWNKKNSGISAYREDAYPYGDCMQVFDLTLKIGLTYANVINYERKGTSFKLWTKTLRLEPAPGLTLSDIKKTKRYTKHHLRLLPAEIETILKMDFNYFLESILTPETRNRG